MTTLPHRLSAAAFVTLVFASTLPAAPLSEKEITCLESKDEIVFVSQPAHAVKDDRQKCIAEGMDDYVSKPVSRQELVVLINKYAG